MSTRSVIARPKGDGWEGRYCHSDGYPTWNGRALVEIVRRDGVTAALERLLTHEWSAVDPGAGEGDEILGYGHPLRNDAPGWRTSEQTDNWDIEWVYVLSPRALVIFQGTDGFRPSGDPLAGTRLAATIPWGTDDLDAALMAAECGNNLDHCSHYAYVHFPELKGTDCENLATAKYLGREPIGADGDRGRDATGFIVRKGARGASGVPRDVFLRATRSGGLRRKTGHAHLSWRDAELTDIWESGVELNGEHWTIPTWNVKTNKPVANVEAVYPNPRAPRTTQGAST